MSETALLDNDDLLDEELDLDEDIELDEPEQPEDDVAALRARIDALEKSPPWLNDLKTIQGRMSSIEARISRTSDSDVKQELLRELRAESSKREEAIAEALSGLDESAFVDPAARQKIADLLTQRRDEESRAALREEILAELKPKDEEKPDTTEYNGENWMYHPTVQQWETGWHRTLTTAGIDIDAEELKPVWAKASELLFKHADFKGADAALQEAVDKFREEQSTAARRQDAKRSAGRGTPKGSGGGDVGPLDPSRSLKERTEYLASIGVI